MRGGLTTGNSSRQSSRFGKGDHRTGQYLDARSQGVRTRHRTAAERSYGRAGSEQHPRQRGPCRGHPRVVRRRSPRTAPAVAAEPRSRSSPGGAPHRVHQAPEGVLDMTADQVQVGRGDLCLHVRRTVGRRLRARPAGRGPAPGAAVRPAPGPAWPRRCPGRRTARSVRLDGAAEVAAVQRVVRRRPAAGRRGSAGAGASSDCRSARVDREAGDAEALLGDRDQLVEDLADLGLGRRRPGRAASPGRRPPRRPRECPGRRTAGRAAGWRRRRSWRARMRPAYSSASRSSTGLSCLHGSAPLGPEVDDDRDLGGALEHVALEGLPRSTSITRRDGGGAGAGRPAARRMVAAPAPPSALASPAAFTAARSTTPLMDMFRGCMGHILPPPRAPA